MAFTRTVASTAAIVDDPGIRRTICFARAMLPSDRRPKPTSPPLDKCFSGCRHMQRCCTRWGPPLLGEDEVAWIEHLLEHDCTPE
jgi:hypothetical protein